MSHPYCISIFQIYRIDYLNQDFFKLKYSNAFSPIILRGQSNFDPHTDFISTWLYPVVFCHCIKNADSPTLKHSELLVSYSDDLRSERYYAHTICELPLTVECSTSKSFVQWQCTPTSHLYIIPVSSHSLVMRITNLYSI